MGSSLRAQERRASQVRNKRDDVLFHSRIFIGYSLNPAPLHLHNGARVRSPLGPTVRKSNPQNPSTYSSNFQLLRLAIITSFWLGHCWQLWNTEHLLLQELIHLPITIYTEEEKRIAWDKASKTVEEFGNELVDQWNRGIDNLLTFVRDLIFWHSVKPLLYSY